MCNIIHTVEVKSVVDGSKQSFYVGQGTGVCPVCLGESTDYSVSVGYTDPDMRAAKLKGLIRC